MQKIPVNTYSKTWPQKIVFYGLIFYAVFSLTVLVTYISQIQGLREFSEGDRLGRDFMNFWTGGRAALSLDPSWLYDLSLYREHLINVFGTPLNAYNFSYPPHAIPLLAPFGLFSYPIAFCIWSLLGLGVFIKVITGFKFSKLNLSLILFAPATLVCVLSGQTGFWTAGLLIGGLLSLEKRPVLAGILFGCLTFKPHMGFLLALALLVGGYWRVIISASMTALMLGLISLLLYGITPWSVFLSHTVSHQAEIISNSIGIFDHMVHTPFKWMINLGCSKTLAYALQAVFALFGAVLTIFIFKKDAPIELKAALLCVLTLLFSPYMAIYDMTLLSFSAWVYMRRKSHTITFNDAVLIVLVIGLPLIGTWASHYNIPLSLIVLTCFSVRLYQEIFMNSVDSEVPFIEIQSDNRKRA